MPIRPSSVVRRPSSSVVNFSIKSLISQKLSDNFFSFLACSFLRMVPMHSKNMDLVESSQRSILKVRKVKFGSFFTWRQFSQKLFDNFFSIYARSFPRRVLMDCQKMDSIESLSRSFFKVQKV